MSRPLPAHDALNRSVELLHTIGRARLESDPLAAMRCLMAYSSLCEISAPVVPSRRDDDLDAVAAITEVLRLLGGLPEELFATTAVLDACSDVRAALAALG